MKTLEIIHLRQAERISRGFSNSSGSPSSRLALLAVALAVPAHADPGADRFREANDLVRAGDYPKAIAVYQEIASSGQESASLYWNWAQAAARGTQGEASGRSCGRAPPSAQCGDWSARPRPPRPIGRPGGAPQTPTTFPKSVQDTPDPFPPGGRARTPWRAHKESPIVQAEPGGLPDADTSREPKEAVRHDRSAAGEKIRQPMR